MSQLTKFYFPHNVMKPPALCVSYDSLQVFFPKHGRVHRTSPQQPGDRLLSHYSHLHIILHPLLLLLLVEWVELHTVLVTSQWVWIHREKGGDRQKERKERERYTKRKRVPYLARGTHCVDISVRTCINCFFCSTHVCLCVLLLMDYHTVNMEFMSPNLSPKHLTLSTTESIIPSPMLMAGGCWCSPKRECWLVGSMWLATDDKALLVEPPKAQNVVSMNGNIATITDISKIYIGLVHSAHSLVIHVHLDVLVNFWVLVCLCVQLHHNNCMFTHKWTNQGASTVWIRPRQSQETVDLGTSQAGTWASTR